MQLKDRKGRIMYYTRHYRRIITAISKTKASRTLFYQVYEAKTSTNAEDFANKCLDFFPFPITHILTDNGLEFTNRLTKPFTPKTNGMVEKGNDIIKNGTIKKNDYENANQMNEDLTRFLIFYNLYGRHGSLRRELKVKTPFNAIEKPVKSKAEPWFEIKPEIFLQKSDKSKNKVLYLKIINTSCQQQPCETQQLYNEIGN